MSNNSIFDFSSLLPNVLLRILLEKKTPLQKVIDALLANLSQKSDMELLTIIQQSELANILTTLKGFVDSGVIEALDLEDVVDTTFSKLQEGEEHLIAVLAFLQLLRSPGDAGTPEEAEVLAQKIEELKALFRFTLFDSRITIQLMRFRDERQRMFDKCSCHRHNAEFIQLIGWYIAAQAAHDKDGFVANSN